MGRFDMLQRCRLLILVVATSMLVYSPEGVRAPTASELCVDPLSCNALLSSSFLEMQSNRAQTRQGRMSALDDPGPNSNGAIAAPAEVSAPPTDSTVALAGVAAPAAASAPVDASAASAPAPVAVPAIPVPAPADADVDACSVCTYVLENKEAQQPFLCRGLQEPAQQAMCVRVLMSLLWWMDNEVYWINYGCQRRRSSDGSWSWVRPCPPHAICSWIKPFLPNAGPYCPEAADYRRPL